MPTIPIIRIQNWNFAGQFFYLFLLNITEW